MWDKIEDFKSTKTEKEQKKKIDSRAKVHAYLSYLTWSLPNKTIWW